MLPSRPNARTGAGGLPSAPRFRAAPLAQRHDTNPREQYTRPDLPTSTRCAPGQRSVATISSSRERNHPTAPEVVNSRSYDRPDPKGNRKSDDSQNSTSSSGSSLFDRMRAGAGYSSPRTSFEDEIKPKRGVRSDERSPKQSRQSYTESDQGEPDTVNAPPPGDGFNIWNRVATAAGTLTVNVSKAWTSNVVTYAGEQTPPGQESRLTRAMKAYHLAHARDPSDLPEWLFAEHERQSSRSRHYEVDEYETESQAISAPPKASGLRDIYAAAATMNSKPAITDRTKGLSNADDGSGTTKATDRLKALRDAKRSVLTSNRLHLRNETDDEPGRGSGGDDPRSKDHREPPHPASVGERRPPPRVGLPSGPGGRARRA